MSLREVSVVIVSYNVSELLRKCIDSVRNEGVDVEIVVVDNKSTDGTQRWLSEDRMLTMFLNPVNVGFSQANNQGMGASFAPYILLLNPDTEMKPGALRKLLDFAATQSEKNIIGPQLLNSDGSLQKSAWKKPSPLDMIKEALFLHLLFGGSEYNSEQYNSQFEPGMISGAAMLFSRKLYKEIGGLDPNLFWMEDADFCTRVRNAGGSVIYFPGAQITHHSGQSSKKDLSLVVSNQLLSKLKYYRKHSGWLVTFIAGWFCFLHIITRIVIFGLLSVAGSRFSSKAAAYCGALPRFFAYVFANNQRVT